MCLSFYRVCSSISEVEQRRGGVHLAHPCGGDGAAGVPVPVLVVAAIKAAATEVASMVGAATVTVARPGSPCAGGAPQRGAQGLAVLNLFKFQGAAARESARREPANRARSRKAAGNKKIARLSRLSMCGRRGLVPNIVCVLLGTNIGAPICLVTSSHTAAHGRSRLLTAAHGHPWPPMATHGHMRENRKKIFEVTTND